MQVTVTFRHMESSDRLRERVMEKIGVLDHFFDRVQDVHVVLSHGKEGCVAEVVVHSPGESFPASAHGDEMFATIDQLAEKLERHFARRKERVKLETRKGTPLEAEE